MSTLRVVHYPDPALRRGGKPVAAFDGDLRAFAESMLETMYEAGGVGLAAPQVARDIRLLVLNETGDREQRDREMVFVNPEIVKKKGHEFGEEGCLSFPRIYAEVERNREIRVKWQDLDGASHEETFTGFLARILQHEIDHLNGVLFVDRLSSVEKVRVRGHLQDMEHEYRERVGS
jgi:peptide deformylase